MYNICFSHVYNPPVPVFCVEVAPFFKEAASFIADFLETANYDCRRFSHLEVKMNL